MPTVQIEAAVVFPALPAVVFEMMTDETYVSRKAEAMGALEHDVTVTRLPDGGAQIRLQRTLPAVVPDFVRPLVGETIEVVQTEKWAAAGPNGDRHGRLSASISNAPVRLNGTVTLGTNSPHSSIHRVDVDVKARVPLLGGKIERAIGEVILLAARKEEEVGGQWLTG
jgi:hypothetical protein